MSEQNIQKQFEAMLMPVLPAMYGSALHLTRNREDAEDLVQECVVQAFRAIHSFQMGTNFKAWVYCILTNLYFNAYRKKKREPLMTDLEDASELYLYSRTAETGLNTGNSNPENVVLDKMDREQIGAALEALPDDYRVVSSLYFMESFSYQEIADIVGIPVGTVRSRLHRGRKMLQKSLWRIAEEHGIIQALTTGKEINV